MIHSDYETYARSLEPKLIHKKGNLITMALNGEFDVIVHGCNCFHKMKSGIAKEIAATFPAAVEADLQTEYGSYDKIGTYSVVPALASIDGSIFYVVNAYTQHEMNLYGQQPKDRFEYLGFQLILQKLLHRFGAASYGFPMIGMGLAGGDPGKILPMLEKFAEEVADLGGSVTLVEFDSARVLR